MKYYLQLIMNIAMAVMVILSTYAQCKDYIVALPQSSLTKSFKQQIGAGFIELLSVWKKGDRLVILSSETGSILCDLSFTRNSPRKHIKDLRKKQCTPGELLQEFDGQGNIVNLPQIMAHLDTYPYEKPELIIFGSPIFKDAKNSLDFSSGFPSDAHITKAYGYHITPFNRAHITRNLVGNVHWLYETNNAFENQRHQQGIFRFYALYFNTAGLKLLTYSTDYKEARRAGFEALPELAVPDLENKDTNIIRFHSVKNVPSLISKQSSYRWQPINVTHLTQYHDTQSTYQFAIDKVTRSIKIDEYDGDDDGSTLVVVIGISGADESVTLGHFIPSGDNVSKLAHLTFPEQYIKHVILYPVNRVAYLDNNEYQEDKLGGMWTINSISVEGK